MNAHDQLAQVRAASWQNIVGKGRGSECVRIVS